MRGFSRKVPGCRSGWKRVFVATTTIQPLYENESGRGIVSPFPGKRQNAIFRETHKSSDEEQTHRNRDRQSKSRRLRAPKTVFDEGNYEV